MDMRSGIRNVIVALVGLGVVVLVIVLLVKAIFGGGSPAAPTVDVGTYANTGATATLLVDDPTNIDQDHRQVKITVGNNQTEIDIIQGYQGHVIDSRTYSSNPAAFGAFLQSLKLLNFSKGSTNPTDYRGYCPTGDRYVYSFDGGDGKHFSYWSTSCNQGTFGGNRPAVRALFYAQIPGPDFDQLTGSIPL
jgi:hypothetical protein